jgi:hypothetical protein
MKFARERSCEASSLTAWKRESSDERRMGRRNDGSFPRLRNPSRIAALKRARFRESARIE